LRAKGMLVWCVFFGLGKSLGGFWFSFIGMGVFLMWGEYGVNMGGVCWMGVWGGRVGVGVLFCVVGGGWLRWNLGLFFGLCLGCCRGRVSWVLLKIVLCRPHVKERVLVHFGDRWPTHLLTPTGTYDWSLVACFFWLRSPF